VSLAMLPEAVGVIAVLNKMPPRKVARPALLMVRL